MVLSMDRWVDKVAIVTEASSGVGAAISERLVDEGLKVVGLARNSEDIQVVAEKLTGGRGTFYAVKADISKEEDVVNTFKWTSKNVGATHILVNNPGIHVRENSYHGNTDNFEKTLDINVLALCIATRQAVKVMKRNYVDGHIIHINSIVRHNIADSNRAQIYTATKHAVTALTETLRSELNALKSKIKVTSISPGCVDIPTFNLETTQSELFQQFNDGYMLSSEDIADAVIYALSTSPHVQVEELTIKPLNEIS